MLRKLKKRLQEASGVYFVGLKQFRATFVQRTIDALVAQGYCSRAAADAVMDATGHINRTPCLTTRAGFGGRAAGASSGRPARRGCVSGDNLGNPH